jgi:hypothetical protein
VGGGGEMEEGGIEWVVIDGLEDVIGAGVGDAGGLKDESA